MRLSADGVCIELLTAVAGERNWSPTALMTLKHYKVLHEHDSLTGRPFFPLIDRAHYGTDKPDLHLPSGIQGDHGTRRGVQSQRG
jgi:hypothetical protein